MSENQNRQSLHATAAFVLAIDDMIMPAAADVVSAHLMNGNAVLELHFSVYQVALVPRPAELRWVTQPKR